MSGPFDAPAGSVPQSYRVNITTVVPMSNTDPSTWDYEVLLEQLLDHSWAEVAAEPLFAASELQNTTEQTTTEPPELVVSLAKARRSRVRDNGETEWEYGKDYAYCARKVNLGTLVTHTTTGKLFRVWLTPEERTVVYDLWCSMKNTTNQQRGTKNG